MSARTHRDGLSGNLKDRIGATKVPLSIIPLAAQVHASLAHFDGSLKYGAFNWRQESVAASIYIDAALRHILKWFDREQKDNDSGLHHLGHAIACLNIIIDAEHFGNLIDDRPPSAEAAALLDKCQNEVVRLLKLRKGSVPNTPPVAKVTGVVFSENGPPAVYTAQPPVAEAVEDDTDDGWAEAPGGPRPARKSGLCAPSIHVNDGGSRMTKVEHLNGHKIEYIDNQSGYVDGKLLRGTDFTGKVALYREGFENADERAAELYRREKEAAANA